MLEDKNISEFGKFGQIISRQCWVSSYHSFNTKTLLHPRHLLRDTYVFNNVGVSTCRARTRQIFNRQTDFFCQFAKLYYSNISSYTVGHCMLSLYKYSNVQCTYVIQEDRERLGHIQEQFEYTNSHVLVSNKEIEQLYASMKNW